MVRHKTLLRKFFTREIRGRFAGSMGGALWLLVMPLCQILVYIFVFDAVLKIRLNSLHTGTNSFVLFFLTGMFPWLAFSEGLSRCSGILYENSNLITKVRFPIELLPTIGVLGSFVINGCGFLIFTLYLGLIGKIGWQLIFIPLLFILFFLMTIGFAAIISALSVFLKDIQQALPIILFVWFYFTPILYPKEMVPEYFRYLFFINPVFPFMELFHSLLLGTTPSITHIVLSLSWTVAVCMFGLYLFSRLKTSFADVL